MLALLLRRGPRLGPGGRLAAAAAAALVATGVVFAMVPAFVPGVSLGFVLGVPVAWATERILARAGGGRRSFWAGPVAAALAALTLALGAFWWLFGLGVEAFAVAIALVAPVAWAIGPRLATPASGPPT